MDRKKVESSMIKSIGYAPETQTLEVEFSGGSIYSYDNVPPATYKDLLSASSIEKHMNANIKGKYSATKL